MRILLAQLNLTIGDIPGNTAKIISAIEYGKTKQADLVLFPELAITGYPPQDFLLLPTFIKESNKRLEKIIQATKGIAAVVGVPRENPTNREKRIYNSAAVIEDGKLLGFQDKTLLPTYDVFDERRYFEVSADPSPVWTLSKKRIGITICEDIWQHSDLLEETLYLRDPILELQKEELDCLVNLSASPFSLGKSQRRIKAGSTAAQSLRCPLVLCNQVGGNDSLIFDGHSFGLNAKGELIGLAKGFGEDFLLVETSAPPLTKVQAEENATAELYEALILGIKDYFHKSGFTKACIGLSGGIDSAVTAYLATEALGAQNVWGIGMPSRYSSEESRTDAETLAKNLGITYQIYSIESPFNSYLNLLKEELQDASHTLTEENLQARIRGMILMALSNRHGYIVLSTGNKSELAVGYSTLYGDMCGGLAVLSDVTKRQVYALAHYINREREIIPQSTLTKPPSAELRPNQRDSDTLPEYDILDNVIEAYIEKHWPADVIAKSFGYELSFVQEVLQKIHRNEYKRRQSPPGLRVTEKSFTIGRHFPIVQKFI